MYQRKGENFRETQKPLLNRVLLMLLISGGKGLRSYTESDAEDEVDHDDDEENDADETNGKKEEARRNNQFYKTKLHRDVQGNLVRDQR